MKAFRSPNGWAVELMDADNTIKAAVLAEREACAKVVESTKWSNWFQSDCAAAIRSRSDIVTSVTVRSEQ